MDKTRKRWVDDILRTHGLGALIFWRPDELVMMLGYMPLWGVSFLVYPLEGEPVLFVPELEPEDILPANVAIQKFPWGIHNGRDPWEVLYGAIKNVLRQRGLAAKPLSFIRNIGASAPCRMSGEQPPLPPGLAEKLSVLSDGGFVDVTGSLLQLYQYKTETDVAGLRLAHQVASLAVKTFYEEVRQTPTEARLAALIECAVQETTGRDGIGFAKAWPMVQSGRHAADAGRFNRSTGKIIGKGELVVLEMGLCVNGYWADITRTVLAGEPADLQLRMFDTVSKSQSKAIASMRPGVSMRDVDAAARRCIEEAGLGQYFNHALGHHVGFRYHDPGDVLSPYSNGVLQEGMVLTVEPGVYGPDLGGGVRIEDNILITGDGHLLLSDYPRTMKGE